MALITAAEARAYIPGLSGTSEDTALDTLITRADAEFAIYLGYPETDTAGVYSIEAATYTLYSPDDVQVDPDSVTLHVPVGPIQSVTSIHDSPTWDYSATYLVDSGDYTTDTRNRKIVLTPTSAHGAWSKVSRSVKLIASLGITSGSAPAWLKDAAGRRVATLWRYRPMRGMETVSQGGVSTTPTVPTLSQEVKDLLAPLKIVSAVWT